MQSSEQESYRERFDRVLAEKELYAVLQWDGATGWTKGRFSLRERFIAGVTLAACSLTVFVYGFYKIVAGLIAN